jgi:hypothetical protein
MECIILQVPPERALFQALSFVDAPDWTCPVCSSAVTRQWLYCRTWRGGAHIWRDVRCATNKLIVQINWNVITRMKIGMYKLSKNLVTSKFLVPEELHAASSYWGPTVLEWAMILTVVLVWCMWADTHLCVYGENWNNYDENIRCHCKKIQSSWWLGYLGFGYTCSKSCRSTHCALRHLVIISSQEFAPVNYLKSLCYPTYYYKTLLLIVIRSQLRNVSV